jgi:hypothetical protein
MRIGENAACTTAFHEKAGGSQAPFGFFRLVVSSLSLAPALLLNTGSDPRTSRPGFHSHCSMGRLGPVLVGFLHMSRRCHLLAGLDQVLCLPASTTPWAQSPESGVDPSVVVAGRAILTRLV